jgi:hypothetical protein
VARKMLHSKKCASIDLARNLLRSKNYANAPGNRGWHTFCLPCGCGVEHNILSGWPMTCCTPQAVVQPAE